MRIAKSFITCGILLTCFFLVIGRASAEIRYDSLCVTPFIEFTRTHDSNLYLQPSAEKSASVSLLRFGADMLLPVRTHVFKFQYSGDATLYSERPDDNNTLQHNLGADISLRFPSGLLSQFKDTYHSAAEPALSEFSEPVKRVQNDLLLSVGRQWSSHFTTRAIYEQNYLDFLKDSYKLSLNRRESQVGMETEYALSPKSSVFAAYHYGFIDYMYGDANNSYSHFVGGGIRGKLTAKTAVEGKAGIKTRFYRQSSANDVTVPVIALSAITAFSERTRLEINGYRNTWEANFTNNSYYVVDFLGAEIKRTMFKEVTAGLKVQYVNNRYPNDVLEGSELRKRDDNRYFAGINCEFPLTEWLTLKEEFMCLFSDSNINRYDYTDRYISISARARY